MQLKAIVKNIAKKKNVSAQLVLQNFVMERMLERISYSSYKSNFILKGGLLIASMIGLNNRATMDIDATLKGIVVTEEELIEMFESLCKMDIEDDIRFEFIGISEIRESDEYPGYRISLNANFYPMTIPLKIDLSTGDKITPSEVNYEYKLLLENRTINILAYNLETVLSEKVETIISRGDQNTRPRDFYDVYALYKLRGNEIDFELLNDAIIKTSKKRNSHKLLAKYKEILEVIEDSDIMNKHWQKYRSSFNYAKDIEFDEVCQIMNEVMSLLNL